MFGHDAPATTSPAKFKDGTIVILKSERRQPSPLCMTVRQFLNAAYDCVWMGRDGELQCETFYECELELP